MKRTSWEGTGWKWEFISFQRSKKIDQTTFLHGIIFVIMFEHFKHFALGRQYVSLSIRWNTALRIYDAKRAKASYLSLPNSQIDNLPKREALKVKLAILFAHLYVSRLGNIHELIIDWGLQWYGWLHCIRPTLCATPFFPPNATLKTLICTTAPSLKNTLMWYCCYCLGKTPITQKELRATSRDCKLKGSTCRTQ